MTRERGPEKSDQNSESQEESYPEHLQKMIQDLEKLEKQEVPDWLKPDVEKHNKERREEIELEKKIMRVQSNISDRIREHLNSLHSDPDRANNALDLWNELQDAVCKRVRDKNFFRDAEHWGDYTTIEEALKKAIEILGYK